MSIQREIKGFFYNTVIPAGFLTVAFKAPGLSQGVLGGPAPTFFEAVKFIFASNVVQRATFGNFGYTLYGKPIAKGLDYFCSNKVEQIQKLITKQEDLGNHEKANELLKDAKLLNKKYTEYGVCIYKIFQEAHNAVVCFSLAYFCKPYVFSHISTPYILSYRGLIISIGLLHAALLGSEKKD